jgi:putative transposase
MTLPNRKSMDHTTPGWLRGSPIFFLTICAAERGINQFCEPATGPAILDAAKFYHARQRWHLHLIVLMPDHLHALVSLPKPESLAQVVRSWKHYLAKQQGLKWQRDFFDHRLRSDESHEQKANYILQNPVRAGLIRSPELWSYTWEPTR